MNNGQPVALVSVFSLFALVWLLAKSNETWRTDKSIEAADSRWTQATQSVLLEAGPAGPPTGLRIVPKADKSTGYAKLVSHTTLIPNVDALLVEDATTGSRYMVILTKVSGYGATICRVQ